MKKLLLTFLMVLSLTSFAFAQKGNCQREVTVSSKAQAQEIVKQQVAALKGYTSFDAEEVKGRKGTAYKVPVKDGAGNKLYYMVSPFGMVFGPITNDDTKTVCNNGCMQNGNNMNNGCMYGKHGKGKHHNMNCEYSIHNHVDCAVCGKSKNGQNAEPVIVTAEQAKNAAEKYIQNLKGYTIENVESYSNKGQKYIRYRANLKDSNGNLFFIHVHPCGNISGLISYNVH